MIKIGKYFLSIHTACLLFVYSASGYAGTALHEDEANLYQGYNFALGIGTAVVKFDSNVKVSSEQGGISTRYLDLEGDLDLPEFSYVTTLYGWYRFSEKHSMLFGHFAINRHSSSLKIDENYDDVIIVNADINVSDKTRFYYLSYGYSLFLDDRSDIIFIAGLNALDLRFLFEASGEITIDNTTRSDAVVAEANIFAPLPLIGLNFGYRYTPKWKLSTRISLVGGSYDDISATVLQTSIKSVYQFSKHVGMILGITYFNASISIEDETSVKDITYGYTGGFIGMHFGY